MMRAPDFEFRQRWLCFGIICCVSYSFLAVDHVLAGERLADGLIAWTHWPELFALHVVFGAAAALMFLAALVRTWGSSYLGRTVVHDAAVHVSTMRAVGLPVREDRLNDSVQADILIGEEGLPRAIRFIGVSH
jgi:hypothetical protein